MAGMPSYNFSKFFSLYKGNSENQKNENQKVDYLLEFQNLPLSYKSFLTNLTINSFNDGVLRILDSGTIPSLEVWNSVNGWHSAWPQWTKRLFVFGYDWMGNQLALDFDRLDDETKEPLIAIVEPGTGRLLKVPSTFESFLNKDLIEHSDGIVESSYYESWRSAGGTAPQFNQCIGYKHPLSLGGSDEVDNLELSDIDVYINIMGQLNAC